MSRSGTSVGNGSENLVILSGITLDNYPANRPAAWTHLLGFGCFTTSYTVYEINRKRSMPPGFTTWDMARDYARAIESESGMRLGTMVSPRAKEMR